MDVSVVKLTENAEQASLSSDNSINLPKRGAKMLTVPDGISSFKVYDDGEGENGHYSDGANGCLLVSASGTDKTLLLTGTVVAEGGRFDYLTVFDGDVGTKKLLNAVSGINGDTYDVGTVLSSGNTMTLCFYSDGGGNYDGLDLSVSVVNSPVVFADAGGKKTVVINGEYTGAEVVDIPKAVEVDAIDLKRELTPKVASTTVLPFTLPENATVNAEFYELTDVVEVDHSWVATMTNIKKLGYNLPKPNTPYAVILHEGESELKFDLKGQKAVVQTGEIQNQKNKNETWYFIGTYAFKDWGKQENSGDIGLAYAFSGVNDHGIAKGTFGRVSTKSTANPMRSYLRKKDESVMLQGVRGANGKSFASTYSINLLPETIDIEFIDSDANGKERTTAIGRMNSATGEIRLIRVDRTFDLQGRSVNREKKNARGAYYGKKVR